MEIVELFKDSLIYPTKEWDKLLIFGAIIVILSIVNILETFGILSAQSVQSGVSILAIISFILLFVLTLLIYGYTLSITRKTIDNTEEDIPAFDFLNNIIDGVKVLILNIVYYIIPVIITAILGLVTGAFAYIYQMVPYYIMYGSSAASAMPQELLASAGISFLAVLLIGGILFLIFGVLLIAAKEVLAETESLVAAINMIDVFKKIGEIGWGNYIIWFIVWVLLLFVISFIAGIITIIPFIGLIIVSLVFKPYMEMLSARALGLIYNESK